MVWWWLLLRKPYSWALCLTASRVLGSLSLLCLVSLSLGAIQNSVILRLLLDLDAYRGVEPLGLLPLFPKKVVDIIAPIHA